MNANFKKAVSETMLLHAFCITYGNESTQAEAARTDLDRAMKELNQDEVKRIDVLSSMLNAFWSDMLSLDLMDGDAQSRRKSELDSAALTRRDVFFFGCVKGKEEGHYVYGANDDGTLSRSMAKEYCELTARDLDAVYAPKNCNQEEGRGKLVYVGGWTIIAFWDRRGDERRNSNSAYLVRGTLTFKDAVTAFSKFFANTPALMKSDFIIKCDLSPMVKT